MRIEAGEEWRTGRSAKVGVSFACLAVLLASAVFLLVGAQLTFFVRLPLLNAYGLYATSLNHLARGVSYSPSSFGGYPIFVVNSDLVDARALPDDIATNTPG